MRKRDRVHLGRMGMALLIAGCCLPWGQISAAAQPAMPEVLEETWKQNDGLLVPSEEMAETLPDSTEEDAALDNFQGASALPSSYSLLDVDGVSYVTSVKDQAIPDFAGHMRRWVPVNPILCTRVWRSRTAGVTATGN